MSERHSAATKRVALLQRQGELTPGAFFSYWAGPHAALASALPGLTRYTQNRLVKRVWSRSTEEPDFSFDGVAELEFDGTVATSILSETAQQALLEDETKFIGAITLCRVSPGSRPTWNHRQKIWMACGLSPNQSAVENFVLAIQRTGCAVFSVEQVESTFHRETLGFESSPPTVLATLWFDPDVNIVDQFSSSHWRDVAANCVTRGAAWLVDTIQIVPALR
ncbi:EthD domain-containing protein [Paraburkholderia silvatlantica]|uniref:EthD domain-containing protein n=1 Tax=Paraburkholderia silvatlantica TaxID=321895 RepID=UPI0037513816